MKLHLLEALGRYLATQTPVAMGELLLSLLGANRWLSRLIYRMSSGKNKRSIGKKKLKLSGNRRCHSAKKRCPRATTFAPHEWLERRVPRSEELLVCDWRIDTVNWLTWGTARTTKVYDILGLTLIALLLKSALGAAVRDFWAALTGSCVGTTGACL